MNILNICSILVVKLDHIGDMILATPVFKSIKEKFPQCILGVLCSSQGSIVIKNNPYIDKIHIYNSDMFDRKGENNIQSKTRDFINILEIRKQEYDICIGLREDLNNIVIQNMLGAKYNISFFSDSIYKGIMESEIVCNSGMHVAKRNYKLLELLNIVRPMYITPELFPDSSDRKWVDNFLNKNNVLNDNILIGISPGGGWYLNWWPWENYAELCNKLHAYNKKIKVIIVGGNGEKKITSNIRDKCRIEFIDAVGLTTLQQLGALYERMKFVICNDGGTMHVATSVGVPVIAMFGPSPERFYPLGQNNQIINKKFPCSPCPQFEKGKLPRCQDNRCMKAIKVDEIYKLAIKKIEEMLPK